MIPRISMSARRRRRLHARLDPNPIIIRVSVILIIYSLMVFARCAL